MKTIRTNQYYIYRYFRDTTWTINLFTNNITEQIVHCHCPKNSITYLTKRQALHLLDGQITFQYFFACSPQAVSIFFNTLII